MKILYSSVALLCIIVACTKTQDNINQADQLEQRNDNHLIYKLAHLSAAWNYTLTNGSHGAGTEELNYSYRCTIPFGRIKGGTDFWQEDGNTIFDASRTMTYNENGLIATEHATENGDDIVRTFNYDADGKWTGITTTVNGVALDDQMTITPYGQVTSYTNNGVRFEYVWRANNIKMIKTYVQPSTAMSIAQNSTALNQLGFNKLTNKISREKVLHSLGELQKVSKSRFRGKNMDEWVLVQIEEQEVDQKIVQPFSSAAKGYPGTSADGGFLILPKNYIVKFTDYLINEDGSKGEVIYFTHIHSVSTRDNLPRNVKYNLLIPGYDQDADGNPIDWNEEGTIHYDYISGCNE